MAQQFFHLAMLRGRKIAKVAMARKLAVHLYWTWRQGWDYAQFKELGFVLWKIDNLSLRTTFSFHRSFKKISDTTLDDFSQIPLQAN